MKKNYGLDFEYNENARECIVKNTTNETMYDIEMLLRVSSSNILHPVMCKYKKIRKIKAGEVKKIKLHDCDIKKVELMKYTSNDIKEYAKIIIPMWLSFLVYFASIIFFGINSSTADDIIGFIIFITIFPSFILIMDAGARYDHRRAEKAYYGSSIIEPLQEMEM